MPENQSQLSVDELVGQIRSARDASRSARAELSVADSPEARLALGMWRRAGDLAMAQVAWEGAAAHYERALHAMDLISAPEERVRVDVLLAMGRAIEMSGADRARWRGGICGCSGSRCTLRLISCPGGRYPSRS